MENRKGILRNIYRRKPDYALLLTEKGIEQAIHTGTQLQQLVKEENMQFYVSPLFRAEQTFQQIIKHFNQGQSEGKIMRNRNICSR